MFDRMQVTKRDDGICRITAWSVSWKNACLIDRYIVVRRCPTSISSLFSLSFDTPGPTCICLFRSYTSKCYYIWHARLCRLHILFLLDCEVEVPSRTVHFISHRLTLLMCPKIIFRLQFFFFSSTLIMPPKTIFRLQAVFFSSRRNHHSNDNVCRAIEYQLQDAREAVTI